MLPLKLAAVLHDIGDRRTDLGIAELGVAARGDMAFSPRMDDSVLICSERTSEERRNR